MVTLESGNIVVDETRTLLTTTGLGYASKTRMGHVWLFLLTGFTTDDSKSLFLLLSDMQESIVDNSSARVY